MEKRIIYLNSFLYLLKTYKQHNNISTRFASYEIKVANFWGPLGNIWQKGTQTKHEPLFKITLLDRSSTQVTLLYIRNPWLVITFVIIHGFSRFYLLFILFWINHILIVRKTNFEKQKQN